MKTYTLKLKTTSTVNYNLYDGTTLVSDADLATLFGSAGDAFFIFDFDSKTPTDTTSLTILDSTDTAVMTNTGLSGIAEDKNFEGVWPASATAFTTFTLLSGVALDKAQISKLATKKIVGAIRLSAADYNYRYLGRNTIALWKLNPGVYYVPEGVNARPCAGDNNDGHHFGLHIVVSRGPSAVTVLSVDYYAQLVEGSDYTMSAVRTSNGYRDWFYHSIRRENVKSLITTNAGAPTTSTVGTVGQLLEDTTNGKLYICTAVSGSTYTWTEVAGGGGPTVVQTTGTSTTDVMSQKAVTDIVGNIESALNTINNGGNA